MTLAEKINISGTSGGPVAVPRLGLPDYWWWNEVRHFRCCMTLAVLTQGNRLFMVLPLRLVFSSTQIIKPSTRRPRSHSRFS